MHFPALGGGMLNGQLGTQNQGGKNSFGKSDGAELGGQNPMFGNLILPGAGQGLLGGK